MWSASWKLFWFHSTLKCSQYLHQMWIWNTLKYHLISLLASLHPLTRSVLGVSVDQSLGVHSYTKWQVVAVEPFHFILSSSQLSKVSRVISWCDDLYQGRKYCLVMQQSVPVSMCYTDNTMAAHFHCLGWHPISKMSHLLLITKDSVIQLMFTRCINQCPPTHKPLPCVKSSRRYFWTLDYCCCLSFLSPTSLHALVKARPELSSCSW